LLQDAVLLVDGLPGVSFPAFTAHMTTVQDGLLTGLRAHLRAPRVPVLLCGMPDAVPSLGLQARSLPAAVLHANADGPAPLLPSAPLPAGATWRPPALP